MLILELASNLFSLKIIPVEPKRDKVEQLTKISFLRMSQSYNLSTGFPRYSLFLSLHIVKTANSEGRLYGHKKD